MFIFTTFKLEKSFWTVRSSASGGLYWYSSKWQPK